MKSKAVTSPISFPVKNSIEGEHQHRILVVEDNQIAQLIAKSLLNKMNCAVDIADSGRKLLICGKRISMT